MAWTEREMLRDLQRCVKAADAIRLEDGCRWELLEPVDSVRAKYGFRDPFEEREQRAARAEEEAADGLPRMKMLCLPQPWAGQIARGELIYDIRSWQPNYDGPIVIVASRTPADVLSGKALAIVRLGNIRLARHEERALAQQIAARAGYKHRSNRDRTLWTWEFAVVDAVEEPFDVGYGAFGLFERPVPADFKIRRVFHRLPALAGVPVVDATLALQCAMGVAP